jgi:hypothetical protein
MGDFWNTSLANDANTFIGLPGTTAYQPVEGLRIKEIKRLNHNISREMLRIVSHSDTPHTGPPRSLDACDRIFDNNASIWRRTGPRCRHQIHFRVRLSHMHIFG